MKFVDVETRWVTDFELLDLLQIAGNDNAEELFWNCVSDERTMEDTAKVMDQTISEYFGGRVEIVSARDAEDFLEWEIRG